MNNIELLTDGLKAFCEFRGGCWGADFGVGGNGRFAC